MVPSARPSTGHRISLLAAAVQRTASHAIECYPPSSPHPPSSLPACSRLSRAAIAVSHPTRAQRSERVTLVQRLVPLVPHPLSPYAFLAADHSRELTSYVPQLTTRSLSSLHHAAAAPRWPLERRNQCVARHGAFRPLRRRAEIQSRCGASVSIDPFDRVAVCVLLRFVFGICYMPAT